MAQDEPGAENAAGEGVSFGGHQLAARPTINVVGAGAPPTGPCPGSVTAPTATSGNLCVYLAVEPTGAGANVAVRDPTIPGAGATGINFDPVTDTATPFGDGKASTLGFAIDGRDFTGNGVLTLGTWAVTG